MVIFSKKGTKVLWLKGRNSYLVKIELDGVKEIKKVGFHDVAHGLLDGWNGNFYISFSSGSDNIGERCIYDDICILQYDNQKDRDSAFSEIEQAIQQGTKIVDIGNGKFVKEYELRL